jgi:hypothetical protein
MTKTNHSGQPYIFEINGNITDTRIDIAATTIEKDAPEGNTPQELLLESFIRHPLLKEIEKDIAEKLREIYNYYVDVDVDLKFEKGSIIVAGFAILKVMEGIVTTIEFTKYAALLIKFITEKVIQRRINDLKFNNFRPLIQVSTVSAPPAPEAEAETESFFNGSPLRMIQMATILNVVLFVGGTVFTGVSIASIADKFQESNRILSETKDRYNTNLKELTQLENEILLHKNGTLDKMDLILNDVKTWAENDSLQLSATVARTAENIRSLSPIADRIQQNIIVAETELEKTKTDIQKINNPRVRFSVGDILSHMGAASIIIVVIIMALSISSFIISLYRRPPK